MCELNKPVMLLTSAPGIDVTKDVGQRDRITYAEQVPALKAGDRVALHNGAHRVYTIGTVMEDTGESEISIRYDFFNPVGVEVNHTNQGHRILSQQEFDLIINKMVRGY